MAKRGGEARKRAWARARLWLAGLLLTAVPCGLPAQTASTSATGDQSAAGGGSARASQSAPAGHSAATSQTAPAASEIPALQKETRAPRSSDQRRAVKLYLESSKLFLNRQFEEAIQGFEKAAALDPTNADYPLAAQVARSHAVTALIQAEAKDRLLGDESAARTALTHALALDPTNFEATQHLDELADDVAHSQPKSPNTQGADQMAGEEPLLPAPAAHSFHLRAGQRQLIEQVFKAYGLMAMLDDSVRPSVVRLDVDDVNFEECARILGMATHTFFVPLDAHHALVADDTRENRQRLARQQAETVYLAGLNDDELNEVQYVAKNVFTMQQAEISQSERTITVRAPATELDVFNATLRGLLDGRSQVLLDVRMIQVAHTSTRNTGAKLPQSMSAFNVYAEEQSILNANQSLVQEIISSGLASPNDPLAILAVLIASGQVSSSLLSGGFAVFGGGIAESALVPGSAAFKLDLNTSDSRELDQIQLQLQDGEEGTIKEGEKYPIQTSQYSSPSPNSAAIAGLTSAGTSSSLTSLLSSLTRSAAIIPMVQYQDLGLTLKATPRVLRNGDVALSIDMKLDALSGQSIDGNPVLDNRAYSGVVTIREGDAAVVATEVDKSQSLAVSGTPGISEIPGLNDLTSKDLQKNYATLVILMTPHVIRGTQAAGHTAMMRVERGP
jgi:Flp pilus assembly secretin CpaC